MDPMRLEKFPRLFHRLLPFTEMHLYFKFVSYIYLHFPHFYILAASCVMVFNTCTFILFMVGLLHWSQCEHSWADTSSDCLMVCIVSTKVRLAISCSQWDSSLSCSSNNAVSDVLLPGCGKLSGFWKVIKHSAFSLCPWTCFEYRLSRGVYFSRWWHIHQTLPKRQKNHLISPLKRMWIIYTSSVLRCP